jgi:hypothetical protein
MACRGVRHNGEVPPDLLWDDVRPFFDPELMGPLPDLCVPETSPEDWQALLDLVASSTWRFEYAEGDMVLPLPRADAVLSRRPDAESASLRVWPAPHLLAIFRFYAPEQIDFDVDLREIQGQEKLDVFCAFLKVIGRRLGKPVLMDAEGGDPRSHPVLGFRVEADRVVLEDELPSPRR